VAACLREDRVACRQSGDDAPLEACCGRDRWRSVSPL